MSRKQKAAPPPSSNRYLPFVIIGAVLVAGLVAALWLLRSPGSGGDGAGANSNSNSPAASSAPANPRRRELPGAPNPHFRGGATAAVTLEEFGDFQCPPCGQLHVTLKKIEDDFGDRLKVVFRNYPLQIHKNAVSAARAAEAAGAQGKFFQMHDMLFERQKEWEFSPAPQAIYQSYASRIGIDVEKFKADMERQDVAGRIQADFQRGTSLGVSGTPTLFLNGRVLTTATTFDEQKLRAEIESALAAAGK